MAADIYNGCYHRSSCNNYYMLHMALATWRSLISLMTSSLAHRLYVLAFESTSTAVAAERIQREKNLPHRL